MLTADILSALSPTLKITGLLLHKFHLNMTHKIKVGGPCALLFLHYLQLSLSQMPELIIAGCGDG